MLFDILEYYFQKTYGEKIIEAGQRKYSSIDGGFQIPVEIKGEIKNIYIVCLLRELTEEETERAVNKSNLRKKSIDYCCFIIMWKKVIIYNSEEKIPEVIHEMGKDLVESIKKKYEKKENFTRDYIYYLVEYYFLKADINTIVKKLEIRPFDENENNYKLKLEIKGEIKNIEVIKIKK
jgi:hypothetical protein